MEVEKKVIAGQEYDYTMCPRCQVYILTKDFKKGTHVGCDKYFKGLETRRRATKRILGIF